MSYRWSAGRKKVLFVLCAGLLLLACQLPSMLARSLRQAEPTSPLAATPSPTTGGKKPFRVTSTAIQVLPSAAVSAYPPAPGLPETPLSTGGAEYPGLPATEQAYSPQTTSPTPSLTESVGATGYPQNPTFAPPAYPGSEVTFPTYDPYPGVSETPASGPENPYPLETATLAPTSSAAGSPTGAVPSQTSPPSGGPSATPAQTSTAGGQPTATRTRQPTATPSPTVFFPTDTPTPTRTPYLTPTPTQTSTSTATRTPLPYPPWMSVKITATDPGTVRLATGKPQLVEFFAYWSGPSLAMAPMIKGVQDEYSPRVNFVFLDIDNPATASLKRTLHFRTEPQFILLDPQGKVIKEWVGYVTVEQLRQAIDSVLY